jgi:cytochrome c-type biogenesis protein CcmE
MDLNRDDVGEASVDSTELPGQPARPAADLRPRTTAVQRKRKWPAGVALALVLAAGGVVLFKGLSSASLYFCNADEVGVKSGCDPDDRFRLQGAVQAGSVSAAGATTSFNVEYNGAVIPARHQGDPPDLFQEGIPVVLEGSMVSGTFESDLIMVKHTEQYRADNPNRIEPTAP